MANNLICPVDSIKISEVRVRLTAGLVFLSALSFLLFAKWGIALGLTIDFALRAWGWGAYSPFGLISGWLEKVLALQPLQVDRGPKIFAARLGFVMSLALFVLSILGFVWSSYAIAAILLLFSFLESALGFCAGCYVYTYAKKISGALHL